MATYTKHNPIPGFLGPGRLLNRDMLISKKQHRAPPRDDDCEAVPSEPTKWRTEETEDAKDAANFAQASMWSYHNGQYVPCDHTVESLPSGQYTIGLLDNGIPAFSLQKPAIDKLFILPDNDTDYIISEIEHFWSQEAKFREFGFLWKRGCLLYGPAGGGKTSTCQLLSAKIIEMGGICIIAVDPQVTARGLTYLRRIEPDRPIVVIVEDIDAMTSEHNESALLSLLDGETQVDNVCFIATCNYPERLDKRITNRPSRFDIVKKIGMLTADARRDYFKLVNPRVAALPDELERWVELSEELPMAHLKEMVVSVECLGKTLDETIERLREMGKEVSSFNEYRDKGTFGFGGNNGSEAASSRRP